MGFLSRGILPGGINVRVAGFVYEPLTRSFIDAKDVGSSRRYCGRDTYVGVNTLPA